MLFRILRLTTKLAMKFRAAFVCALALLCGCATDTTRYVVGESGTSQTRADAEKTHRMSLPVRDGVGLDSPLRAVSTSFPEYPPSLRNYNLVGSVRVRFFVEADGTVSNPSIVGSPPPALAALSLHAIMLWRFEPPIRGGKPVRVPVEQEFAFSLQ